MAEKFTAPSMDWSSPGDVHKRFKLFKQKCELIFDGPLEEKEEDKKVRLLLLWVGDKGLDIYNTSTWASDDDKLKLAPVFENLEAYTKPQSNHILARFQLRSLKQGEMSLEAFITKAKLLIDDSGYDPRFQDEVLRDTLVFGISSDKVRKDAIALGNSLTLKQVYELAKTEETTKEQMKVISGNEDSTYNETHAVYSKQTNPRQSQQSTFRKQRKFNFKINGCFRCGNKHDKTIQCPALNQVCSYCKKTGHFSRVCMARRTKEVQEIVENPNYQGQDIHLNNDMTEENNFEGDFSGVEEVNVYVESVQNESSVDSIDRIYTNVKINDKYNMRMKIDTGADTCIITTNDLQNLPFPVTIESSNSILRGYGGSHIQNLGTTTLKITVKDKTINAPFNIVPSTGSPSMIGCKQSQDLGIIEVKLDSLEQNKLQKDSNTAGSQPNKKFTPSNMTKETILKEYKDCFALC